MENALKKVPVYYVGVLLQHCGNAMDAAVAMGVSPSTITRAVRENETTARQEQKALEALTRLQTKEAEEAAAKRAPVKLLVSVPQDKRETFQKVVEAMGLECLAL